MDSQSWKKVKAAFGEWLDLPAGERTEFLRQLNGDIRLDVERLAANYSEAEHFIESAAVVGVGSSTPAADADDPYIGETIDGYRIVSRIGTGGMGAVYLAEHHEEGLDHTVALKLVKRGMDTTAVLKRFFRERQILANLEHPNIARFLDAGSTPSGIPYFVMERIEGLPIRQYCEERRLSTREILRLYVRVCSAVSFAHQKLTVHRDIKPSNILVTQSGEPKLLDFGIAKLLNRDWQADPAEATATMFRVLTPEYASPEQIRGEAVTTSADVYSLGVVLYELLTGRRPFVSRDQTPNELAEQILTLEPPRPSSVVDDRESRATVDEIARSTGASAENGSTRRRQLPLARSRELRGDVDNILLKALQKSPERRYQSVQEFSSDISRHLDGLPVTASADTIGYRFSRFVRRHKAAVAAACVVAVILVTASVITGYQARRAEREAERARKRFDDVRSLANSFMFEFHDAIRDLPGSTAARSLVTQKALQYLEVLAAESDGDSALRYELAAAFSRVAAIQGANTESNLGDSAGALTSYDRARELLEPLIAAEPQNIKYLEALGSNFLEVNEIAAQRGETEVLTASLQRGIELYEQLVELQPERHDLKTKIGDAYKSWGDFVSSRGDLEGALANYQRAESATRAALAANPADADAFSWWLSADEAIAATLGNPNYTNLGRVDESIQRYSELVEALKARPEVQSGNKLYRANLAYMLQNHGLVLGAGGRWAEALSEYEAALSIQRDLAGLDAKNAAARWRLANCLTDHAEALAKLGRLNESLAQHREALALLEAAAASDAGNTQMQLLVARSSQRYGDALVAAGRFAEARAGYERAIEINRQKAGEDATNMDVRWALADDYLKLGRLLQNPNSRLSDATHAAELLQRSRKTCLEMLDAGLNIKPITDRLATLERELASR